MPISAHAVDPWAAYVRDLGHLLHRLRVDRGLSQERLSAAAGISTFTYRKLEKGESNPDSPANPQLFTLARLAEVMEVDVVDLLPSWSPRGIADGR